MSESSGVRPPLQARSHRTFVALLDATEELLEDRLFSNISVQEIVARADSSSGSFYARFESKKALLGALQDRLHETMKADAQEFPRSWTEGEVSARSIAEAYVDKMTADHGASQGLIRALIMETQADSTIIEKSMVLHRQDAETVAPFLHAPGRSEVEKADAIAAASLALLAMLNQAMLYSGAASDDSLGVDTDDVIDGDSSSARDGLIDIFLTAMNL